MCAAVVLDGAGGVLSFCVVVAIVFVSPGTKGRVAVRK